MKNHELFKLLGDETRLTILCCLKKGERCVHDIVDCTERTQSTVSIHLSKLEEGGIVSSRRDGKCVYYRVSSDKVLQLMKICEDCKKC